MAQNNNNNDDDYMSDIFVKDETDRVKRKNKSCRNYRPNKISKKAEEAKIRQEGLNRPLTEDNKGYEMLCKMGYQPGLGLGKSG